MKNFIFLFLSALPAFVFSQEISRQVVAPAGNEQSNDAVSLSWTLGETVTASFDNDAVILIQGFQQGNLTVSNLVDQDLLDFVLKAYPNPVIDILILESDDKDHSYQLINIHGEHVQNGQITSPKQEIDFTDLPPGIYFLSIDQKQTHKIIKQ